VVNGSVRDVSGILEIEGFHGFVRDFHPTALADTPSSASTCPSGSAA